MKRNLFCCGLILLLLMALVPVQTILAEPNDPIGTAYVVQTYGYDSNEVSPRRADCTNWVIQSVDPTKCVKESCGFLGLGGTGTVYQMQYQARHCEGVGTEYRSIYVKIDCCTA